MSSMVSKGSGKSGLISYWWLYLILIFASFLMIFPFLWQAIMSLSTNAQVQSVPPTLWPGKFQWHNYLEVFKKIPFGSQFLTSVAITILRTLGQVITCSLAGYALARLYLPYRHAILALILSILMVPSQVYLIPQFQIIKSIGLLNTIPGIVLPGLFSAFGVFLMRQFFMGIPRDLEEAARIDGASDFQIFMKIMLPLAKPGISALVIMTVLWSWNDLMWPMVVSTESDKMPLSAGLATFQGDRTTDYAVMMAAAILAMAPILILFLFLQRRVIEGLAHSGIKG